MSPHDPQTLLHQSQFTICRVVTQNCAIFCGPNTTLVNQTKKKGQNRDGKTAQAGKAESSLTLRTFWKP